MHFSTVSQLICNAQCTAFESVYCKVLFAHELISIKLLLDFFQPDHIVGNEALSCMSRFFHLWTKVLLSELGTFNYSSQKFGVCRGQEITWSGKRCFLSWLLKLRRHFLGYPFPQYQWWIYGKSVSCCTTNTWDIFLLDITPSKYFYDICQTEPLVTKLWMPRTSGFPLYHLCLEQIILLEFLKYHDWGTNAVSNHSLTWQLLHLNQHLFRLVVLFKGFWAEKRANLKLFLPY